MVVIISEMLFVCVCGSIDHQHQKSSGKEEETKHTIFFTVV